MACCKSVWIEIYRQKDRQLLQYTKSVSFMFNIIIQKTENGVLQYFDL